MTITHFLFGDFGKRCWLCGPLQGTERDGVVMSEECRCKVERGVPWQCGVENRSLSSSLKLNSSPGNGSGWCACRLNDGVEVGAEASKTWAKMSSSQASGVLWGVLRGVLWGVGAFRVFLVSATRSKSPEIYLCHPLPVVAVVVSATAAVVSAELCQPAYLAVRQQVQQSRRRVPVLYSYCCLYWIHGPSLFPCLVHVHDHFQLALKKQQQLPHIHVLNARWSVFF